MSTMKFTFSLREREREREKERERERDSTSREFVKAAKAPKRRQRSLNTN